MVWQEPKTDWNTNPKNPRGEDFNRIEGNIEFLKQDIETKKALIVDALNAVGISTLSDETYTEIANKIIAAEKKGVVVIPGTTNKLIPKGIYDDEGYVAGDPDLVSSNIKSGANIFGVQGNSNVVDTSAGDATAEHILSGKKAYVGGALVTGSIPNRGGATIVTPSTADQKKYKGYYSGDITIKGDPDLVAGNIKHNVDIFGKVGTFTSDGNISASDVVSGKVAYSKGARIVGTNTNKYGIGDRVKAKPSALSKFNKTVILITYATNVDIRNITLYDGALCVRMGNDDCRVFDLYTNTLLLELYNYGYYFWATDNYIYRSNGSSVQKFSKSTLGLITTHSMASYNGKVPWYFFPTTGDYFYGGSHDGMIGKWNSSCGLVWGYYFNDTGGSSGAWPVLFRDLGNGYGIFVTCERYVLKVRLSDGYVERKITTLTRVSDVIVHDGYIYVIDDYNRYLYKYDFNFVQKWSVYNSGYIAGITASGDTLIVMGSSNRYYFSTSNGQLLHTEDASAIFTDYTKHIVDLKDDSGEYGFTASVINMNGMNGVAAYTGKYIIE